MKIKKKLRSFRCADSLYTAVEIAAKEAEMSVNEWTLTAIRSQLKTGVTGEGINIEEVENLAKVEAINNLTVAISKTQQAFASAKTALNL